MAVLSLPRLIAGCLNEPAIPLFIGILHMYIWWPEVSSPEICSPKTSCLTCPSRNHLILFYHLWPSYFLGLFLRYFL